MKKREELILNRKAKRETGKNFSSLSFGHDILCFFFLWGSLWANFIGDSSKNRFLC